MKKLLVDLSTVLACVLISTVSPIGYAENFGGPDAVENQIAEDAKPRSALVDGRASQSWFDWKSSLQEDHGFSFGVDYTTVYLGASDALDDDSASGGMIRFFGSWDLLGRGTKNTGAFVWKVEHRHGYTDIAPSGFGFLAGDVLIKAEETRAKHLPGPLSNALTDFWKSLPLFPIKLRRNGGCAIESARRNGPFVCEHGWRWVKRGIIITRACKSARVRICHAA